MTRMNPPAEPTIPRRTVRVVTALLLLALVALFEVLFPRQLGEPIVGLTGEQAAGTQVLGATENRTAPKDFTLAGTVAAPLVPGSSQPLDVVITNPGDAVLTVTTITVSIGGPGQRNGRTNPSCPITADVPNIVVAKGFSGTVVVPAGRTMALSALGVARDRWPVLAMPNLPVDQGACQNTTFPLVLTGSGRTA